MSIKKLTYESPGADTFTLQTTTLLVTFSAKGSFETIEEGDEFLFEDPIEPTP